MPSLRTPGKAVIELAATGLLVLVCVWGIILYRQGAIGSTAAGAVLAKDMLVAGGKYVDLASGRPISSPVIAAAGDIACDPQDLNFNAGRGTADECRQMATSDLIVEDPAIRAVLTLGDTVYECGSRPAFEHSYHPSWGRFKDITRPVVGNHEYYDESIINDVETDRCDADRDATPYYDYFGAAAGDRDKGYYSYDLGDWHMIALNSNCNKIGGCAPGSRQYEWLESDLAKHRNRCVLAYYHHPVFSQDITGGSATWAGLPLWQLMYREGVDVVLNGHSHNYQRYSPMDLNGLPDTARGIREFIVGTGGAHYGHIDPYRVPFPEVAENFTFGVVKMTLHPDGYEWRFVPEAGKSFTDAGAAACH